MDKNLLTRIKFELGEPFLSGSDFSCQTRILFVVQFSFLAKDDCAQCAKSLLYGLFCAAKKKKLKIKKTCRKLSKSIW